MNTQQTLDQLRSLKLHGMAKAYEVARSLPVHDQVSGDPLIAQLVESECH